MDNYGESVAEIIRINLKTVANVLADCLERAHEFKDIIIVGTDKEGDVLVGWSEQKQSDLAYSLVKLQGILQDELL